MEKTCSKVDKEHKMILKDWDIWHSYSNYFIEDFSGLDLKDIARLLVQSNLCAVVYHSDNQIWWKDSHEIKKENVDIKKVDGANWIFTLDTSKFGQVERNYALEGAFQASTMRISELRLFGPEYLESFSYIRGYLNACYIYQGDRVVTLYPQMKIYNNGIFNLTFRLLAADDRREYPIDAFIEHDVNFFKHKADFVEVPPDWIRLFSRDIFTQFGNDILKRYKIQRSIKEIDKIIDIKIKKIDEIVFKFETIHLDEKDEENLFVPKYFDDIKNIIISSFYFVINQTNEGMKYIIFGPGAEKYHVGKIAISRPSIYILDFVNQPDTSNDVLLKYGDQLGKIAARITHAGQLMRYLERNLRALDDYTLHMNKALTLWVFSKKGLDVDKDRADPNRGHLIYEKQVLVESIDYMHTCYRRYAERSYLPYVSYSSSIKEQLNILKLNNIIGHTCYAGELDDVHIYAAEMFKLSELFNSSMNTLKLKGELIKVKRNENLVKIGLIVSVLFGLSSLPVFANGITKPAWNYFGIWLPEGEDPQQLLLIAITIIIFIIVLTIIWTFWQQGASHHDRP
jgi:hypothetical protein